MPYFMTTSHKNIPNFAVDEIWEAAWGAKTEVRTKKMHAGLEVGEKYLEKSGYLTEARKEIPPLFCSQFWYCSEVIKAAIERLEPKRHQFHPFSLRDQERKYEVAQLYIINILDSIDALDLERSENLEVYTGYDGQEVVKVNPLFLSKDKREIALYQDRIKNRHLWMGPGAFGPAKAFISDELHDIIKENDISPSPLRFYRTKRTLH
ncbi:DUF1629 domain-containing protein [Roseibium sp. HPY-6]|uniref:imm11 family protein n=1 Tax=Roseibium sp. HPY-6 TaxID=3229852 RepID=UPI00338FD3E6